MENKIYWWKNDESLRDIMEFEPFTLEEYNEQFCTQYKSLEQATENDSYLWSMDEIETYCSEGQYKIL